MITVYGTITCPDCSYVEAQIEKNPDFNFIDIGEHVNNLKPFLKLRDADPAFADVRGHGKIGIPCFVKEDGTVTLSPEEVGLKSNPGNGAACSIDGKGC